MEFSLGKQFLVIILLIFGNGIFSLLEMAIVSCHQSRLEALADEGSKSAAIVLKLRENPNKMFSMVQFGITLVSLLTGVYGGTTMAGPLSKYVAQIPGLEAYAYTISLTGIVAFITYLTIILGEIVPKRIAIDKPEKISCLLARPMLYFSILCTPVVWILSWSTAMVTKIMGVNKPEVLPVTEDEIKLLLEQGVELGAFEKEEPELVDRVFRLADMDVGDIMTNRTQVDWIDVEDPEETMMQELVAFNHNTLPVGRGSLDDFIGMISVSEIFQKYYAAVREDKTVSLTNIVEESVHKPIYIPESMDIMKVVHVFREHSVHEVAVLDEYGNFSGILTLHDILEELVGTIQNEHTQEKEEIQPLPDGAYEFAGTVLLDDVEELLHIPVEDDVDTDTIGGYVFNALGHTPKVHDEVTIGAYCFTVLEMQRFRIVRLKAVPLPGAAAPGEDSGDEEDKTHES